MRENKASECSQYYSREPDLIVGLPQHSYGGELISTFSQTCKTNREILTSNKEDEISSDDYRQDLARTFLNSLLLKSVFL